MLQHAGPSTDNVGSITMVPAAVRSSIKLRVGVVVVNTQTNDTQHM